MDQPKQEIIITAMRYDKSINLVIIPRKTADNIGQIVAGVDVSYIEIPNEIQEE